MTKEYLEIGDKKYEITGHAADGLPIIKGEAVSTQDGYDEDGNPKISVKVNVPSILIGLEPGKVE